MSEENNKQMKEWKMKTKFTLLILKSESSTKKMEKTIPPFFYFLPLLFDIFIPKVLTIFLSFRRKYTAKQSLK
jgi:hypothetical protein